MVMNDNVNLEGEIALPLGMKRRISHKSPQLGNEGFSWLLIPILFKL